MAHGKRMGRVQIYLLVASLLVVAACNGESDSPASGGAAGGGAGGAGGATGGSAGTSTGGSSATGGASLGGSAGTGGASAGGGAGAGGGSGGAPPKLVVLFVGNSYTAVNDLPGTFSNVALSVPVPPDLQVSSKTVGGAKFATHYNAAATVAEIGSGNFTHVVLQGNSLEPIGDYAVFEKYGLLLAQAASTAGSSPVFYETWAREAGSPIYGSPAYGGNPQAMQDLLHSAYDGLSKKAGGTLAHVGDAWREALSTDPTLALHQSDGSHPTALGTYLTACVFFGVLTGRSPLEITTKPNGASDATAKTLRAAAAKVTP